MKAILAPWGFMRILRLVMGVVIMYQSFANQQPWIGVLGGFFVIQVLMNTGCNAAGCNPTITRRNPLDKAKEVVYEDV
ncbi:hypothetical protein [Spirosoma sp.]|uniref:hypothetical protein n=1 Tax=Spirosoma sp. TaxID=1899569 RepID=UPI0026210071|nr:hypothetical protein [Spirosoma sp.]MCX6218920.1 hypothetical protein [Spirosoma sp.]